MLVKGRMRYSPTHGWLKQILRCAQNDSKIVWGLWGKKILRQRRRIFFPHNPNVMRLSFRIEDEESIFFGKVNKTNIPPRWGCTLENASCYKYVTPTGFDLRQRCKKLQRSLMLVERNVK